MNDNNKFPATWEQAKQEIAESYGYNDWDEVSNSAFAGQIEYKSDEAAKLMAERHEQRIAELEEKFKFMVQQHDDEVWKRQNAEQRIAELENQWISVENNKPNNNDIVIISCEHGVTIAQYTCFKNGNELWWAILQFGTYEDSNEAQRVTHWMPLPKPPQK